MKKKFGELIRSEDIENYIIVPENNINGIFDVRVVACSIDGNDINQTVESDALDIYSSRRWCKRQYRDIKLIVTS